MQSNAVSSFSEIQSDPYLSFGSGKNSKKNRISNGFNKK